MGRRLLLFESANVSFIYSVPKGSACFLEEVNKIVLEFRANPCLFFVVVVVEMKGPALYPTLK